MNNIMIGNGVFRGVAIVLLLFSLMVICYPFFADCTIDGLTISPPPPTLPDGSVGMDYGVQFVILNGTPPYYFLSENFNVPGLTFTSDGLISGVPTVAGVFNFDVYVTDSTSPYPCYGNFYYTLTISDQCPLILLEPNILPPATVNSFYSQRISASGGTPPYTFSLGGGTMPQGLSITTDGLITGTPSESGQFNFLIVATDAKSCTGGASYSLDVQCASNYGSLSGYVGISLDNGTSLILLDGDSVSGTITAKSESGEVFTSQLQGGYFDFGTIPSGIYTLSGEISYKDYILYDANMLSYGCVAPANSYIEKITTLENKSVDVKCDTTNRVSYTIKPPIVMIHGSFDCYEKWFSGNSSEAELETKFDNYARQIGFISFTPNYSWWNGSYIEMASEILNQINTNLSGITKSGIPPFYVLSHDTGGLILRVLGSSGMGNNLVGKIKKAFLLAPPNSGFDFNFKAQSKNYIGKNLIINYFNDVYPNFGKINVFPIAGNWGFWGSKNNDTMVSVDSVFNIKRSSCFEDDCIFYPSLKLPQNSNQILPFKHKELGSPPSLNEVFNLILSNLEKSGFLEAPIASVEWGTSGVTSKKIGGGSSSILAESVADYQFNVSKCDGIAIFVNVTSGSGTFKIIDASGVESEIEGGLYWKTAPQPGGYVLRVIPDSQGVSFEATIIENSIFGIESHLSNTNFHSGDNVMVRVDKTGDWSNVSSTQVSASLYNSEGNLIQTILLVEKGSYYSGNFTAPDAVGNYNVVIEATGLYDNSQFSRVEFESMDVIPNSHLFSNNFEDFGSDLDGDGKYDAITINYSVNVPNSGYFVVSADLYDSNLNFISHSSDNFISNSSGIFNSQLNFDLSGIHCEQFSGKFIVSGLKFLDGGTLNSLDVWNTPIETKVYSQSQFECDSSSLNPSLIYVTPSSIAKGQTIKIAISGRNFKESCSAVFESPISVLETKRFSDRVVVVTISVPENAPIGYYDVSVINPDGKIGKIVNGLLVTEDTQPVVSFIYPNANQKVSGLVNVTASASDDIKVVSVSFELDDTLQKTVYSYPFIWQWDTSQAAVGTHRLKATATDSSSQTSSIEVSVDVIRGPSVTSIRKKSNPFRLVVSGSNFQNGIEVYINGERWDNVSYKNSNKIVLKGGKSLKAKVPKGEDTTFRFVNPDGGEATYIFRR